MELQRFSKRIESMPTSIFSVMSKMAFEYKAVNLGQGFPDFDGPLWIMEEAFSAMKSGKNQYATMNGILSLRKQIQEYQKKYYDLDWDAETEITVTAGATESLYSTITSLVNEGDEVIMFEPFYDSHQADVTLAGGIPRYVTLHKPDFSFKFEDLEKQINPKTKAIILNNPHNPTGKVYTVEELEYIASLAVKHDIFVISDEVYEFLTFDEVKHIPIATLPGMRNRTITISSTGKTFGMTGWKVGYSIANSEITKNIQKVHQWVTFAVNTPGQQTMAYAFSKLDDYIPEFRKLYQQKRDFIYNALIDSKFKPHLPRGSYFMMVDIPNDADKNDFDVAFDLVKKNKVATIPPSVFYNISDEGKKMLRLCFAKTQETLTKGVENLKSY